MFIQRKIDYLASGLIIRTLAGFVASFAFYTLVDAN